MPVSMDDEARLPPMLAHADVVESQRKQDLKDFRRFLVDTGAVPCLVKMFQHIAKEELKIDKATVVKDFLTAYVAQEAQQAEVEHLQAENAALKEKSVQLMMEVEALESGLVNQSRSKTASDLWAVLAAPDFWEGVADEDLQQAGMTLGQLYTRLCGNQVDPVVGVPLADFLKPMSIEGRESVAFVPEDFLDWAAGDDMEESLLAWVREVLLPRLQAEDPGTAPFAEEVLEEVRGTGLYPDHVEALRDVAKLDEGLRGFLDAAAAQFA